MCHCPCGHWSRANTESRTRQHERLVHVTSMWAPRTPQQERVVHIYKADVVMNMGGADFEVSGASVSIPSTFTVYAAWRTGQCPNIQKFE